MPIRPSRTALAVGLWILTSAVATACAQPAEQATTLTLPIPTTVAVSEDAITVTTASPFVTDRVSVATSVLEQPQDGVRLRVLTFNMHHGKGSGGTVDLQRVADMITRLSPDLVSLQEVEVGTERSGGVDQAQALAELTGLEATFGWNIDFRGGGFGNAILSAHPIVTVRNHILPSPAGTEQRGVLEATIELPDGQLVVLLSTHLDHDEDESVRLGSVAVIEDLVGGFGGLPAILAADLNAEPGSETLDRLLAGWTAVGSLKQPTYPAIGSSKRIDHILVQPVSRWVPMSSLVVGSSLISDHRAVLGIVELVGHAVEGG